MNYEWLLHQVGDWFNLFKHHVGASISYYDHLELGLPLKHSVYSHATQHHLFALKKQILGTFQTAQFCQSILIALWLGTPAAILFSILCLFALTNLLVFRFNMKYAIASSLLTQQLFLVLIPPIYYM